MWDWSNGRLWWISSFFLLFFFWKKRKRRGVWSEYLHFCEFFLVFLFSFSFECKIAIREKDEEINCLFEIDRRIENECSFHVEKYLEMWNEYLWILFLRYSVIFFSFSFHFHLNLHLNCSINSEVFFSLFLYFRSGEVEIIFFKSMIVQYIVYSYKCENCILLIPERTILFNRIPKNYQLLSIFQLLYTILYFFNILFLKKSKLIKK